SLPFNITIAFSQFVDPYVAGVYVNYLVPVISILDIFAILALLSCFKGIKTITSLPKIMYFLVAYGALHLIIHYDINSVFWIGRFFLYGITVWHLIKKETQVFDKKFLSVLGKVLLLSIVIQLIIGGLQFLLGKSLGI